MSDAPRIKKLLADLAAERARGLMWRRAIMVAILFMFAVFFGNAWYQVKTFDAEALMVELESHAVATVWPVYSRQLESVFDDAVPALGDALSAEAESLLPRVTERLSAEAVIFQTRMGEHMGAALDRDFAAAAKGREAELKAKFPGFAEDPDAFESLMNRLGAATRNWAEAEFDTTFAAHITVLDSINASMQKLQIQAEKELGPNRDAELEDVLVLMAEILNTRVAGGE